MYIALQNEPQNEPTQDVISTKDYSMLSDIGTLGS